MPLTDFIRSPDGARVAINTDHIVTLEPHSVRFDLTTITLVGGRSINVLASEDEGTVLKIADAVNTGKAAYAAADVDEQAEALKPARGDRVVADSVALASIA